MNPPHRWMLTVAAALMAAGCSTPNAAPPASSPAASTTPSAAPATTTASGFCLDLTTFQVGVVVFRSDVGKALGGEPLDFEDLRKMAANIAFMGEQMRASAPPDISEQFRAVLDAIATSASRLKPGARARDVVVPLYGEGIDPAFDAVGKYECR